MANKMAEKMKLIVVGDGNCGKTLMLSVFQKNGVFDLKYIPTVFETYVHNYTVDGKDVELEMCDTAGQEQYDGLRKIGYDRANVVLLVYSIAEPASLENAVVWEKEVRTNLPTCPIILVGNKSDLRSDKKTRESLVVKNLKPVTQADGRKMKNTINAVQFLECSALENVGIQEVFQTAVRTVFNQKENNRSISFWSRFKMWLFSF